MITTDFLVIGGGVIGLNLARELRRKFPGERVTLIEKEPELGLHASGRNSGVLHAGFYYTADSLKAKFTRQGNLALTEYCASRKIPVNACGKLVVAKDEREAPVLDELLKRARAGSTPGAAAPCRCRFEPATRPATMRSSPSFRPDWPTWRRWTASSRHPSPHPGTRS